MGTDSERQALRRVVTGHSADGTAKVLWDGPAENCKFAASGAVSRLVWSTHGCPADISIGEGIDDRGALILGTAPPPRGSRFAVIDYPPGAGGSFHRTESLDYVIVVSGAIEMELDEGAVSLAAGDVLVQRGTNHRWTNRGATTARVAFVLLDAVALGIGKPIAGGASSR